MEPQNEQKFYDQLAETPDLPPELFGGVQQGIRRRQTTRRTLWSLAAAVVIALGLGGSAVIDGPGSQAQPVAQDVADELSMVYDYVHGLDVETQLDQYAISDVFLSSDGAQGD